MLRNAELQKGGDSVAPMLGALTEKIEVALRKEIERRGMNPPADDSNFRTDMGEVCRLARRTGMRAESLVIAVKTTWQSIPESNSFARHATVDSLLSEMVTVALDEFYDSASHSG